MERVLELLPDVPAGKLAIADLPLDDEGRAWSRWSGPGWTRCSWRGTSPASSAALLRRSSPSPPVGAGPGRAAYRP